MNLPASTVHSAYIHVPFCRHRCGYCDFTLVAGRDDLIDDYLHALSLELESLGHRRQLQTLFLGGGTPTHLSTLQLGQLFDLLNRWFEWDDPSEVSVEANPLDMTEDKISLLASRGVNRISLGIQSFQPDLLALLERDHSPSDILYSTARVKNQIENISLDLIFAIPGQSLESWTRTIQQAIELQPSHISTYCLTIEKGTVFWSRREQGTLKQKSDDVEQEMYAHGIDRITAAGFEHYEISNFARPGFRCRHNEVYWKGLPYFAFGPGAARYVNGRRETNHRSVTTWIKRLLARESPVAEIDELSPQDRAREALVIGLRLLDGVELAGFQSQTGFSIDNLVDGRIRRLISKGWLEEYGGVIRLTKEGLFMADTVAAELL